MTSPEARTVRLDIASRIELLDTIQVTLTHLAGMAGFDEEACHYMSVAMRESVVNAIKHGNQLDEARRVAIEFVVNDGSLEIHVEDQGKGFDPGLVCGCNGFGKRKDSPLGVCLCSSLSGLVRGGW